MSEDKGLTERLSEVEEKLNMMLPPPKKEKMTFKLKPSIRAKARRAADKGKILVFYLKSNRFLEPIVAQVKAGMVQIGDKVHDAAMCYYYLFKMGSKTIPCLVVPEWSLRPIAPKDYYNTKDDKLNADNEEIIIKAIEMKENMMLEKKGFKMSMWIWIIIGAAILGWIFFGGG